MASVRLLSLSRKMIFLFSSFCCAATLFSCTSLGLVGCSLAAVVAFVVISVMVLIDGESFMNGLKRFWPLLGVYGVVIVCVLCFGGDEPVRSKSFGQTVIKQTIKLAIILRIEVLIRGSVGNYLESRQHSLNVMRKRHRLSDYCWIQPANSAQKKEKERERDVELIENWRQKSRRQKAFFHL